MTKSPRHCGDPGCHGNLRDFTGTKRRPAYSVGGAALKRNQSAPNTFQPLTQHAVHLPESFRGGCSFGAAFVHRGFPKTRAISPASCLSVNHRRTLSATIGAHLIESISSDERRPGILCCSASGAVAFDLKARRVHVESGSAHCWRDIGFDRNHLKFLDGRAAFAHQKCLHHMRPFVIT